jgi:hypothetical protein
LALSAPPLPAAAMVIDKCFKSGPAGFASVDPVVARGAAVSAHEHTFFGNTTLLQLADPSRATYDQLQGQPGTCLPVENSAAYWLPSAFVDPGGAPARAGIQRMEAYYRSFDHKVIDTTGSSRPFPNDLRMVAGNSGAIDPLEVDVKNLFWSCGDNSTKPGSDPRFRFRTPVEANCSTARDKGSPTTTRQVFLTLAANFPSCWDGKQNDHTADGDTADYNGNPQSGVVNHLKYLVGGKCPAGFPNKLMQLTQNISYQYKGNGTDFLLSCGPAACVHVDYINAWPEAIMQRIADVCVNNVNHITEAAMHRAPYAVDCGPPI